jgi:hypothetical protein
MLKRRTTGFEPVNNGTTIRCRNPLATPAYDTVRLYLIFKNYEEYVRLLVILMDILISFNKDSRISVSKVSKIKE